MVSEFHKEFNSAQIHKELQERHKLDNESSHEYILHMRKIAFLGDIDEKSVIQYIVDGVRGKPEQKIGLYSAKNFTQLKEQFEIYDRIQKSTTVSRNRVSHQTFSKKEHCFNCGSEDHRRSECKSNVPKCFKCNTLGHISKNCSFNRQPEGFNIKQVNVAVHRNMLKIASINGVYCKCLTDGGSEVTLMKETMFMNNFPNQSLLTHAAEMVGLGGAVTKPKGRFMVEVQLDHIACSNDIVVVADSSICQDVILGFDLISKFRYSSDENGYVFHCLVPHSYEENEIRNVLSINFAMEVVEMDCPPDHTEHVMYLKDNYIVNENSVSPVTMKI